MKKISWLHPLLADMGERKANTLWYLCIYAAQQYFQLSNNEDGSILTLSKYKGQHNALHS